MAFYDWHNVRYEKSPKHDPSATAPGRRGARCPPRKTVAWAQALLDASLPEDSARADAKRYALDVEHGWFCAKPHRLEAGLWHGWPVDAVAVPTAVRRELGS